MNPSGKVLTLKEIMETEFPEPTPRIKNILDEGEVALFIARQKEGKSTLAYQLGLDISCGDPFLGRFDTTQSIVLYIDYENRYCRLKQRGMSLAGPRSGTNLYVQAFDNLFQRDVGLFGEHYKKLEHLIKEIHPGLLILDPLRYAALDKSSRGTSDEKLTLEALDQVFKLQNIHPGLSVILVHHLKKQQEEISRGLKADPRSWIDRVYGSQVLLAHVETIWGLEDTGSGHTFATVPRSHESLILTLDKEPDSERFLLSSQPGSVFATEKQLETWSNLPPEFGWREIIATGISSQLLNAVVRKAQAAGLLMQDLRTKKYRKKDPFDAELPNL